MSDVKGLLFDLDGVLVTGGALLPGARETLQTLLDEEVPFRILSNVTLAPRRVVSERFQEAGLDLSVDRVLTPPAAAARYLRQQGDLTVALFVAEATYEEFEGLNLLPADVEAGAEYVVIGDMGEQWDAHALNRALRLLLDGADLIALGMGRYWQAPDGLRLDTGAYVQALSYATGKEPIVVGKPAAGYFHIALDMVGLPAEKVAMVGDDIISDVGAAQKVGMAGVLVRTGKFREEDLERGVKPDHVVPDVSHVLKVFNIT